MSDDTPVTGWSVPASKPPIPLLRFIWWRVAAVWGREFNELLLRRARRVIGFQWRDRVFIGVLIGDAKETDDAE